MKNWLNNKVITKTIDGHEVRFRRVPVGTLQKFKFLSDDISKALAMLFKDTTHDIAIQQRSVPTSLKNEDGTIAMSSEYVQEAAVPANLQLRKLQMEEGIKGLMRSFMADEAMEILSEIVVKSAFEEFSDEDIPRIKTSMDPATMLEFLKGAFEASAGDYEKLGKSLFQKVAQTSGLLEKVENL